MSVVHARTHARIWQPNLAWVDPITLGILVTMKAKAVPAVPAVPVEFV